MTADRTSVAAMVRVLGLATLAFATYGLVVESPFTWVYVAVTVILAVAVFAIHRSVGLSALGLWLLVGVAIGNLFGGIWLVNGQPLYVYRLVGDIRYDKPFHTLATAIAAWVAYEIVYSWAAGRASRPAIALAALMIAAGAGALVEVVEYVGALSIENANVGDYGDTMLDLVVNTIGAAVAVFIHDRYVAGADSP